MAARQLTPDDLDGLPSSADAIELRTNGHQPSGHVDLAAEAQILGHILNGRIDPASIPADTFTDYRHQAVHSAAQATHTATGSADPATVLHRLHDTHTLTSSHDQPGPYLFDLYSQAVGDPHYWLHAARQAADRRRIVATLTRARQKLDTAEDPPSIEAALWDTLTELLDPAARADRGGSWQPHDIAAVLAGHEPPTQPTILTRTDDQPLIYPAAVHTFSGEPGTGKTWVALLAAAQQLHDGHHVTYIDFEDRAARVIARLQTLGAADQALREHLSYIRPHEPLDPATAALLDPLAQRSSLVVIDGVTEAMTMHGLDLNDNTDVARFYELLPRRLARHGAAVVLIDHVVKDAERQGRWGLGGQHKLAGIDGVAYTVKTVRPFGRGQKGHARITIAKDREGQVEENALGRTAGELHIDDTNPGRTIIEIRPAAAIPTDERGDIRPTALMEKVSRWLEHHPGATKNDVVGEVQGKRAYVIKALDALVHEGRIEVTDGPNRSQMHRVIQPFRLDPEADDRPWETE